MASTDNNRMAFLKNGYAFKIKENYTVPCRKQKFKFLSIPRTWGKHRKHHCGLLTFVESFVNLNLASQVEICPIVTRKDFPSQNEHCGQPWFSSGQNAFVMVLFKQKCNNFQQRFGHPATKRMTLNMAVSGQALGAVKWLTITV